MRGACIYTIYRRIPAPPLLSLSFYFWQGIDANCNTVTVVYTYVTVHEFINSLNSSMLYYLLRLLHLIQT